MNATGSAFVRAAQLLAERVAADAIHHEGRCSWLSFDVDESDPSVSVVERSTGPDLYAGTAGIGLALAQLRSVATDAAVVPAAKGALRHALANVDEDLSLHGGRAGVALAALVGGRLLEDDDIRSGGVALARRVAEDALRGGSSEWDLIAGDAGIALALVSFADETGDPSFLEAAGELATRLANAGATTALGTSWPSQFPGTPALVGLGHGASGAALALSTVAQSTGNAELAMRAADALRYERAWRHALWGWPDLRETSVGHHGQASVAYPVQWCHGSAGAGIARARMLRLPGAEDLLGGSCLSEVAAAVEVCTTTLLRQLAGPDPALRPNLSVCHGAGSVVELHLECYLTSGDEAHLGHARRIMLAALGVPELQRPGWDDGSVSDADLAAPLATISCGLPGGPEVPGLMLGLAGVVTVLLRLADPSSMPAPGLAGDTLTQRTSLGLLNATAGALP